MTIDYITTYNSPNFGYPDGHHGGNDPQEIVIHHTGKDGTSFDSARRWLCNPKSEVSANFLAYPGKVACLVNMSDPAWHSGNRWHNCHSIGIECDPMCTDDGFETVAQLVAGLWRSYGKELPLIGHKDVVPTGCPGRWYDRLPELAMRAHAINHPEPLPEPEPDPEPQPRKIKFKIEGEVTIYESI